MSRYLSSFIATTIIYTGLIASVILLSPKHENISDKDVEKPILISVNMLAQPEVVKEVKKPEPKKVVKQKPKPKPEKKPEPKPKPVEKKIIPVKKAQEKKEPEPEVEEEVVKEETVEDEPVKEPVSQPIVKRQTIAREENKITQDEIKAKQNLFFTEVRRRIDQNKSYPRVARRRGIEGEVEVSFYLLSDGNVKNIEFLNGKRIFNKSIIKAIEDSFPMEVDTSLFKFPKKFKISVKYILK
jgi:protein TonB